MVWRLPCLIQDSYDLVVAVIPFSQNGALCDLQV